MDLTAVGVDLGGTKIAAALVNEQGRMQVGEALVAGMVSLVNAFNPCRLILGGGVIGGLPELVEKVERGVAEKALEEMLKSTFLIRKGKHNESYNKMHCGGSESVFTFSGYSCGRS